jgi:hypothetical protein
LDLGLLGPTEAESFAIILYLATALFGPNIWTDKYNFGSITLKGNEILLYAIVLGAAYTIMYSLYDGLTIAKRDHKIHPLTALSQLIPFVTSWIFGFFWVYSSPRLYEQHPHLFITAINLLFSYLVVS